jgi:hypothetical protein
MFGLGLGELVIVLLILLILFNRRLPDLPTKSTLRPMTPRAKTGPPKSRPRSDLFFSCQYCRGKFLDGFRRL